MAGASRRRVPRALSNRDDVLVVVGTIDGTPIGFGAVILERLRSGRTLGVITDLFVEEGARRSGWAKR